MKKVILIVLMLISLGIGSYYMMIKKPLTREEKLNDFILNELSSPQGGIYTNYLATEKQLEWATGHEVLSESIGLMMLAAYYDNDKVLFEKYSDYLDAYLKLPSGVYAWRILEEDVLPLTTNASIDDLRIAKAYYLAYVKWGDELFLSRTSEISEALLTGTVSGDLLYNYTDGDANIDLSYLDIYTMSLLSSIDNRWKEVKRQSVNLIHQGYLGDDFPFYHKVYNTEQKSYVVEESINMIDALLVLLHLSEESRAPVQSLAWLKTQLEEDTVYGHYRYGDWMPFYEIESTAVYALIMRIAVNMNDEALYELAFIKAMEFQILDETSPLFGAFAFIETLEAFSFDQLQMLLALRRG